MGRWVDKWDVVYMKIQWKKLFHIEKEILLKLPCVTIRGTCNALSWVKQARHRKTNTAWYNLYVKPHMHKKSQTYNRRVKWDDHGLKGGEMLVRV